MKVATEEFAKMLKFSRFMLLNVCLGNMEYRSFYFSAVCDYPG